MTLTGSAVLPKDTSWHQVVGTYDGSEMRLYLDGEAAGSLASTLSITTTTQQLILGDKGGADETSIYERALTPAEVAAHWDAR